MNFVKNLCSLSLCIFLLSFSTFVFSNLSDENQINNSLPKVTIVQTPSKFQSIGLYRHVVFFDNFPKNKDISILFSRVIQKNPKTFKKIEEINFSEEGFITLKSKNNIKIVFYDLSVEGFAKGERANYRFIYPDGTTIAETSYIPIPIHVESNNNTFSVDVELLSVIPSTSYGLYFTDINENEKINVQSISGKETIEKEIIFHEEDANIIMPGNSKQFGGNSSIIITRASGDTLMLKLLWGSALPL